MNTPQTQSSVGSTDGSAFFALYKGGRTGGLQLAIEDASGSGFRIAGPKFNGSGKVLQKHKISERDAKEIRSYLDRAFPPNVAVRDAEDRP